MKKSASILCILGVILFLIGLILGGAYILTGNTMELNNKNYFVGHLLNSDRTFNKDDAPEKLSIISMLFSMLGLILSTIGIFIESKGKTRSERKQYTNSNFLVAIIGFGIGIISILVLMVLVPKETSNDSLKIMTWYYLILAGIAAGIITTIVGVFKAIGNLKKSIINETTENVIKKDEF